ncbi:MAG: hypothetical protein PUH86_04020, partial [Lachnospiraceae bacterium]|nr:hypothetical protein [Lachnospiraceae bacterium]
MDNKTIFKQKEKESGGITTQANNQIEINQNAFDRMKLLEKETGEAVTVKIDGTQQVQSLVEANSEEDIKIKDMTREENEEAEEIEEAEETEEVEEIEETEETEEAEEIEEVEEIEEEEDGQEVGDVEAEEMEEFDIGDEVHIKKVQGDLTFAGMYDPGYDAYDIEHEAAFEEIKAIRHDWNEFAPHIDQATEELQRYEGELRELFNKGRLSAEQVVDRVDAICKVWREIQGTESIKADFEREALRKYRVARASIIWLKNAVGENAETSMRQHINGLGMDKEKALLDNRNALELNEAQADGLHDADKWLLTACMKE